MRARVSSTKSQRIQSTPARKEQDAVVDFESLRASNQRLGVTNLSLQREEVCGLSNIIILSEIKRTSTEFVQRLRNAAEYFGEVEPQPLGFQLRPAPNRLLELMTEVED